MAHEECCVCGEHTGKAGQGDGSLYAWNGGGPFCEACWDRLGLDDDGRPAVLDEPPATESVAQTGGIRAAAARLRRAMDAMGTILDCYLTTPASDMVRVAELDARRRDTSAAVAEGTRDLLAAVEAVLADAPTGMTPAEERCWWHGHDAGHAAGLAARLDSEG